MRFREMLERDHLTEKAALEAAWMAGVLTYRDPLTGRALGFRMNSFMPSRSDGLVLTECSGWWAWCLAIPVRISDLDGQESSLGA